jgi:hypothetical protein
MATMTLPIRELELSVSVGTEKARAETECVVFYSEARSVDPLRMTVKLGFTALVLKFMLSSLARHQRALIRAYQQIDFGNYSADELIKWAEPLQKLAERGRPVLRQLEPFGPRGQKLWGSVLSDLSEQLDHFESIAQSLRSAADPETSLLMGIAVRHMAAD